MYVKEGQSRFCTFIRNCSILQQNENYGEKNNKAIHTTPSKHFQNLIEKLQKEMENRYSDTHIHTPEGRREGRVFIRTFGNQEEVFK